MDESSKGHRFFVSRRWTNLKLAFKPALAVTITLALGQNTNIVRFESSTSYLSSIFAILLMPNKGRLAHIEQILVASTLVGLVIPFCMLSYLSAKATRSPARDAAAARTYLNLEQSGLVPSLATFYQPEAAAVSAVYLFLLSWGANVAKTIFIPFTTPIVTGAIIGGVLLLEGYLAPTWTTWYTLTKQLLYNAYIGFAVAAIVNLVVFPYNAREPYLRLMGDFLDATEQMITHQSQHFSSAHIRMRAARKELNRADSDHEKASSEDDEVETQKSSELSKLQGLRHTVTMLAANLELTRVPAKREITFGHLDAGHIQEMHKLSKSLLVPLFGCNLWSQIATEISEEVQTREDEANNNEAPGFLMALGAAAAMTEETEARLFVLMEDEIAPRLKQLSEVCQRSVEHIKRALQIGAYKRAPFYARPFVKAPRPYDAEDMSFSDELESVLTDFWNKRYVVTHVLPDHKDPHTSALLIIYMEATMHGIGNRLLEFCRWADRLQASGMMRTRRLTLPRMKRYTRPLAATLGSMRHIPDRVLGRSHAGTDLPGDNEAYQSTSYQADAATVLLTLPRPDVMRAQNWFATMVLPLYNISHFIFESQVSNFGFRAAIAMTASALPAYFPDSVHAFLEYRLLWISFTILIGLQPVLGRGVAAIIFRIAGTLIGGVLGLLAVEIGRVPAGIIPVFFITALPQFYILQLDPKKYMLTILLSTITEVLVVGYETSLDILGRDVIERSGQAVLAAPALMGYRICLTLAGVVFIVAFSLFPALPTARGLLQSSVAKHFINTADSFMLKSLKFTDGIYDLPDGLDKAIIQKQTESIVLSTSSHDFADVTVFEPSPRGRFPRVTWNRLLILLDNYNTALAVSNNLLSKLAESDPGAGISIQAVLNFYADPYIFKAYSSCLLNMGDAIQLWRPLPLTIESPLKIHTEARRKLNDLITIARQKGNAVSVSDLNKDTVTYICAMHVTEAIMAKYLSDCLRLCAELVGESGYKSYLSTHRKQT